MWSDEVAYVGVAKRRQMRRKVRTYFFVFVLVLVAMTAFLITIVNPTVANYGQAELEALTVKAVNMGISQVVAADTYQQLTDIRRNASGTIVSISADAVQMNKVSSAIATKAQTILDTISDGNIPIPVGTFSGIPILVGKGPPINLNIQLVGAVNCRFDSTFTSAGINQTNHKIILSVDTVVNLVLPLYVKRTEVSIQILFSDSIIVGEVPEFFFTR